MSCSKCETEGKFPVRSKLYIEKTGSFLAFGLSQENKMSQGNIKLPVSTVVPCKRPVSQLFRNFDFVTLASTYVCKNWGLILTKYILYSR